MKLTSVGLLIVGVFLSSAEADFAQLASELPACGLQCIQTSLLQSPCSLTDVTCLCTNPTFIGATQACVAANCTVKEQLRVVKINNLGCNVPVDNTQASWQAAFYTPCALALIAVLLRVWLKLHVVRQVGPDDWTIFLAGILTVGMIACLAKTTEFGFGLNMWDIEPVENLYPLFKLFLVDQCFYLALLAVTKISLLFFIVRIFPSPFLRRWCWIVGVFSLVYGVAIIFVTIFTCIPVSASWTRWDGEAPKGSYRCNEPQYLQTYIAGGINIAQDFAILLLPLPEIYRLRVTNKKKIQLFFMFSLGLFVTIASIVRMPYVVDLGKSTNPTRDYIELTAWSLWETQIAIVCACMPALRHLTTHYFPHSILKSTVNSAPSKNNDSKSWRGRSFPMRSDHSEFHELDQRPIFKNDSVTDVEKVEEPVDRSGAPFPRIQRKAVDDGFNNTVIRDVYADYHLQESRKYFPT